MNASLVLHQLSYSNKTWKIINLTKEFYLPNISLFQKPGRKPWTSPGLVFTRDKTWWLVWQTFYGHCSHRLLCCIRINMQILLHERQTLPLSSAKYSQCSVRLKEVWDLNTQPSNLRSYALLLEPPSQPFVEATLKKLGLVWSWYNTSITYQKSCITGRTDPSFLKTNFLDPSGFNGESGVFGNDPEIRRPSPMKAIERIRRFCEMASLCSCYFTFAR